MRARSTQVPAVQTEAEQAAGPLSSSWWPQPGRRRLLLVAAPDVGRTHLDPCCKNSTRAWRAQSSQVPPRLGVNRTMDGLAGDVTV